MNGSGTESAGNQVLLSAETSELIQRYRTWIENRYGRVLTADELVKAALSELVKSTIANALVFDQGVTS